MANILVLGAGMVGRAMALDLAQTNQITIADKDAASLQSILKRNGHIKIELLDVTDRIRMQTILPPFDLIVCAVPGFLGFNTLKTIIELGKNVVDISFFPEDALELRELAVKKGVTAIVDCGVAPGMDNILLGHYNEKLKISDFECLVGGLPKERKWPFCYKAPFSPIDVIEEYTRPARYVENGQEIVRPALTDVELLNFEDVGSLESFNSDGLRSLIQTMPHIPNMKEKTLRYPGHVEYIQVLKESGFFDTEPVTVEGKEITPLNFTSKILFKEWRLKEEEEEITVMRIRIKGKNEAGKEEHFCYELFDRYCKKTNTSSMARTTGYTATAAVNLILKDLFKEKGVFPPELVGAKENCFAFVLDYLKERDIHYVKKQLN